MSKYVKISSNIQMPNLPEERGFHKSGIPKNPQYGWFIWINGINIKKNIKKNLFYPLFLWWQKLSQPKRSDGTRGPWAPLASGDDPAFGTVTKNPGFFLADFQETIWKSTVKYNGNVPRMFHSCKIGMFFNVRSKSQIKVNLAVDTASPSSNLGSPFFHVMARSFTPSPPPGPQDTKKSAGTSWQVPRRSRKIIQIKHTMFFSIHV